MRDLPFRLLAQIMADQLLGSAPLVTSMLLEQAVVASRRNP